MSMVADDRQIKSVDAFTRQAVIAQAGVDLLDAMNPEANSEEEFRLGADQILLEALYAHGEFELVRAYKEARKRMAEAE